MHQGWPKFVASLWMATPDNGLAAISYDPSEVRTKVSNVTVHIVDDTALPFDESVTLRIDPESPVTFPLKLRIPGWTSGVSIRVNGAGQRDIKPGEFFTLSREWKAGDTIIL